MNGLLTLQVFCHLVSPKVGQTAKKILHPVHFQQDMNRRHRVLSCLKAVDTIGNCQRLAFTVGVSQHMHKITTLWKFELNRSSNLWDNNERKNTLVTWSCVRLNGWFWDLKFRIWGLEINHLNAHNFVWPGCFFFHYYLASSMTDWAQTFTGLLFHAYVEIHQLWRLVFDNYQ